MAWWLQIILAVVLVVLGALLVPLLLQLRRTAVAMEHLAVSAREDLGQIAADVHHLRARADELADLLSDTLELPASLGRICASAARTVEGFLGRRGPGWLGALLTGLRFALNLVRRRREGAPSKEATE